MRFLPWTRPLHSLFPIGQHFLEVSLPWARGIVGSNSYRPTQGHRNNPEIEFIDQVI